MNSSLYNKRIVIPESPSGFPWKRIVDTSMPSPDDFTDETVAQNIADSSYNLKRQSLIVLIAGK
jgi:hypothetical protein